MSRTPESGSRSNAAYHLFLPLWQRVVFVDWFGVLSTDLFWHSIVTRETHPHHRSVELATATLFRQKPDLVKNWMRGRVNSAAIVDQLELPLNRRYKADFFLRRLLDDCRRMTYRADLLSGIRRLIPNAHILIATDNMDCFASQLPKMRSLRFEVDDVLVSSKLGVLKTDSVKEFFGQWLRDHALTFERALLIDDNAKTCDAFRRLGGDAIVFSTVDATLDELAKRVLAKLHDQHGK
jgi:FMN phosphatase YigB (HAD superfamily)